MAIVLNKPSIEKYAFQVFNRKFKAGKFGSQRYGQAFYDYFKLHKLVDQESLKNLYAKDEVQARNLVKEIFKIH